MGAAKSGYPVQRDVPTKSQCHRDSVRLLQVKALPSTALASNTLGNSLFGNVGSRTTACCTHLHETEPLRVVPDCSFIQRSVNSRKHLSRQPCKHRVGFYGSLGSSTHCDSRDDPNAWKPERST